MKKIIALLLVAVMVLPMAACGGAGGGSGYEAAIDLLVETQYQNGADKLEKLAPEMFWNFYETNYGMPRSSMINEATWAVNANYESLTYSYGENFTAKGEIVSAENYSADDMDKIKSAFAEQKGITKDNLTDAKKVTVKIMINDTLNEQFEIGVVKIGNAWYCVQIYIWDEGCSVMFFIEGMVSG